MYEREGERDKKNGRERECVCVRREEIKCTREREKRRRIGAVTVISVRSILMEKVRKWRNDFPLLNSCSVAQPSGLETETFIFAFRVRNLAKRTHVQCDRIP